MFQTRSRRRRLSLGAAVAACSLAGVYGGSASALNLDNTTDTNVSIDADTHSFQSNLRPLTVGDYQYFAHWDAADGSGDVILMLTRRQRSTGTRTTLRFDGGDTGDTGAARALEAPMDGHNYIGLGIDRDGRFHMSWSPHTDDREHRYIKSDTRCTTNFTFSSCNFVFTTNGHLGVVGRDREDDMTYPTYFTDSRGRLYFAYRQDASARGDEVLHSYDSTGNRWTERGIIFRGRQGGIADNTYRVDPDGDGRNWIETVERGVYIEEWEFDSRDRLHALWIWKENNQPYVWRHGLNYAYSDDFGDTWYYENNRRTGQIADLDADESRDDPITIRDLAETQVFSVPAGWDIGATGFELDSNGNPHTVVATNSTQEPDDGDRFHLQTHYWRTSDKQWYKQVIETTGDVEQGMAALPGNIFFDKADNAYAIFARNRSAWIPWNADGYVQAELPYENVTWQAESGSDGLLQVQLHDSPTAETCLMSIDHFGETLDVAGNSQVRMKLRNDTDAEDVSIWWLNGTSSRFRSPNFQTFTRGITANSTWRNYTFTITDRDNWVGEGTNFMICFVGDRDNRGSLSIDWIDVYNPRTATSADVWDFLAPIEMYVAEARQNDNWATWTVDELFPGDGIQVTGQDGYWLQDTQAYKDSGRIEFNIHQQTTPGTEILSMRSFGFRDRNLILKDWRFDKDPMGWTAVNHVRDFAWRDDGSGRPKGISGNLNGNDSALLSQEAMDTKIDGNGRYVHMTMKHNTAARSARLWFRTATDRTWNSTKSKTITNLRTSGNYETYTFDMQDGVVRGWDRSLLYQIEIDPIEDAGITTGRFEIDRIWIDNTP